MPNESTTSSDTGTKRLLGFIAAMTLVIVALQVCFGRQTPQCVQCPTEVTGGDTVVVQPGDTVVVTGGDSVMVTGGDSVMVTAGDRASDDSVVVVGGDSAGRLIIRRASP